MNDQIICWLMSRKLPLLILHLTKSLINQFSTLVEHLTTILVQGGGISTNKSSKVQMQQGLCRWGFSSFELIDALVLAKISEILFLEIFFVALDWWCCCTNVRHITLESKIKNYEVLGTWINPLSPKISLVILLTICHTVLVMLVWRI